MEIILPAAGLSTRFPNMRPKFTLTDYKGMMMFERAIQYYIGKYNVTIGILKEHDTKYNISTYPSLVRVEGKKFKVFNKKRTLANIKKFLN